MRESIRSVTPMFNTHRMVKEYTQRLYRPAARAHREFSENDCAGAAQLSQWKIRMRKDWPQVRIEEVVVGNADRQNIPVGESLELSARVHLGEVNPQHVRVEAYHGENENGGIKNPAVTALGQASQDGDGRYIYRGSVPASESGAYGFSIRVIPTHPHLQQEHELRLITWS
jgi:starch phosphorylase